MSLRLLSTNHESPGFRRGERQEALKRWSKKCCAWLHSKAKVKEYALELHSARIFENPSWAGYEQFWRDYAPCLAKEGEHRYETGRIDL